MKKLIKKKKTLSSSKRTHTNTSATNRRNSNRSHMALKQIEIIEIDDYSPSPKSKSKGTPVRSIFCLKNRDDIHKYEEEEDCFILDFDPNEKPCCKDAFNDDVDLRVVAEKGQVACRDYPHSRHTCAKYPFQQTPHDNHCKLCYCYVCDLPAPCSNWTGTTGHCHAFNNEAWKERRSKHQLLK